LTAVGLPAAAAFVLAVTLFVMLQAVGLRLRDEERRAWWAGTGRDLINAAGFGVFVGALRLCGYPAAPSVLIAATLTLLLFGLYVFMATQLKVRFPRLWALVIGLLMAAPVLAAPGEVLELFERVTARLFWGKA
jgi:hypothetical protein